eukprot:scaffold987_cov72-Skeletonema_dohrnii-CCMP3373.AAC.1
MYQRFGMRAAALRTHDVYEGIARTKHPGGYKILARLSFRGSLLLTIELRAPPAPRNYVSRNLSGAPRADKDKMRESIALIGNVTGGMNSVIGGHARLHGNSSKVFSFDINYGSNKKMCQTYHGQENAIARFHSRKISFLYYGKFKAVPMKTMIITYKQPMCFYQPLIRQYKI